MAFCDYHPCDHCGDRKTFYDADMSYGWGPGDVLLYGGYEQDGVYIGYRAYALCHECAKTHTIVIVPRDSGSDRNGEDSRSEAECEASQSGLSASEGIAHPSARPSNPDKDTLP